MILPAGSIFSQELHRVARCVQAPYCWLIAREIIWKQDAYYRLQLHLLPQLLLYTRVLQTRHSFLAQQIIQIYWKLRADDIPVSVLLKELIRKGLRYGDIEAAPNPLHAKKVLASYCDSHYTLNLSPFLINSDPVDTKTPFIAASPPSADVEQQAEKISRNPLLDFI